MAATSGVESVLEHLAGLEREHTAGADRDLFAGLRIATDASVLVAHHEVAEAGDLDLLAALQRFLDGVEHGLDDFGRFLLREPAYLLVDVLDDVGLRHGTALLHVPLTHCAPQSKRKTAPSQQISPR